MKKALLIVTMLVFTLGATSLIAAEAQWAGTYWGDASGIWNGYIHPNPSGDPYFEGLWYSSESEEPGSLYGVLYSGGIPGYYRVYDGIIYDEDDNNIGTWYGWFDKTDYPGVAAGGWSLNDGTSDGEWSGYSPPQP